MAEPGPSVWNFTLAFRTHWFAAMSGSASVPFTILATLVDSKWAQVILALCALTCAWFAAYRVWKAEREKVIELEKKLNHQANRRRIISARDSAYQRTAELFNNRVADDDALVLWREKLKQHLAQMRADLGGAISDAEIRVLIDGPTGPLRSFSGSVGGMEHNWELNYLHYLAERIGSCITKYS
jgi:hypothetical protein